MIGFLLTVIAAFAPPANYSFAPPPALNDGQETSPPPPPPPPPAEVPDDASGEDAYARRLRLSQAQSQANAPSIESDFSTPAAAASSAPPEKKSTVGVISAAPVRYNFPEAPAGIPATEEELAEAMEVEEAAEGDEPKGEGEAEDEGSAPRSNRPGQKKFAQRYMEKLGWTKGSGLGARGTGIVSALHVKVEKRKKRPDSQGGGFVGPGSMGKIVGGKKGAEEEEGQFGAMSEVVVLWGMVDGLDLDEEIDGGNLVQEIGEECGEKYGRVERVFIHRGTEKDVVPVYVKFTNQLSALRVSGRLMKKGTRDNC